MFAAVGRFAFRYRWLVIGVWVVIFALGAIFAPKVSSILKGGAYGEARTEATVGAEILQRNLGFAPSSLTVVFSSDALTVDDPRFVAAMKEFLDNLQREEEVRDISTSATNPAMVSPDKHATYAIVNIKEGENQASDLYLRLKDKLPTSGEVKIAITGVSAIYPDIVEVSEKDLRRAETYSLPLVLVALLIVFGSLIAAGAPLIVGAASVAVTLAVIYFLGHYTDMSVFVMNMASMLGLGIAIDYSLFMVSRFREELREHDVESSVVSTVATAGKAIFFSGATTFVGLMGLVAFKFSILRSLGIGGALVVAISVLAALTFLPAAMGVVGHRINALSFLRRKTKGGFWHNVASRVMKYPIIIMVLTIGFLLILGLPFLNVELGEPDATMLPKYTPSRQGYDILKEKWGVGEISPITIAVRTQGSVFQPENISALYDFTRRIAADPRVSRVESLVNLDPSLSKVQYQTLYVHPEVMSYLPYSQLQEVIKKLARENTTLVRVVTPHSSVSGEAKGVVKMIRDLKPAGLEVYVTGLTAGIVDITGELYRDFLWILLIIVGAIYFALLILFRSVILPLKAVLMNGLSILASYGALVFIFQEGHFSGLLNFTPQESVEASLPILMFCILFGLSMDYEVFLLSRVKEVYDSGESNTSSVAIGLERTGGIITSAALIMVLVSASFAMADIVIIKALGLGIAIAIFLDATIVRALLVPATMRVLGDWNWWAPGFIRKILPPSRNIHH